MRLRTVGFSRTSGAALALALMALSAFAQPVNRQLRVSRNAKLHGQEIAQGTYSFKFSDDGSGDLVVMKGSKEIARSPFKLVKLARPASEDTIMYSQDADHSFTFWRIEFKGLGFAVEF